MVRPSNPLLMSAVLNAVTRLSEGKGSSVRDILDFVRQNSNGSSRNLTMQVHRALKHAVNAGLLRHRGGRYKILISVNPISAQQSLPEDSKSGDDIADKVPNGSPAPGRLKGRVKESGKQQSIKRLKSRKRIRSRTEQRKYSRPRKHVESVKKKKVVRKQKRKSSGKVEEYDDWVSPGRHKRFVKQEPSEVVQEDLSPSSDHSRDQICGSGSDVSDDSTYERSSNAFRSKDERRLLSPEKKRSQVRQQIKGQSSKARSRKRSTSRNRSPQRQNYNQNQNQQQQQLEIQEVPNDNLDDVRMDCEQVHGKVEDADEPANPDTDRTCKANNSGSGSSL